MTKLPVGWSSATLLELAGPAGLVSDGDWVESKDQNPAGHVRLIQLADVGDGRFLNRSNRFMDGEAALRLGCTYLLQGDVLIARMPEPLGRACIFPAIGQTAVTVVDVMIWRPDPQLSAATSRWLMHAINSPDVREHILLQSSGTTRTRIAGGKLKELRLSVPPIDEQHRIASKIDGLFVRTNAARTNLSKIPGLIETYRQRTLLLAFSGELSSRWRAKHRVPEGRNVRLGDVAESFQYGTSAKSVREGAVPVLRMGNIQGGKLDWSELVFTSSDDEVQKYRLRRRDVLFNRTNSPELVGKTALFDSDREAIAAGYLIRVRCGPELLPEYLTYLLNSPLGRSYCQKVKTDGVSQSNISAKKLANFQFLLPTVAEQTEIVRNLEQSFKWIERLIGEQEQTLLEIGELEQMILRMAYRGSLIAQDAADAPIGEILGKINADCSDRPVKTRVSKKARGDKNMPSKSDNFSERLKVDSGEWPKNGLPFEEISKRLSAPYESIREALFALLSTTPPVFEQHFDQAAERILIRRNADAS